jgi:hypothetical protein
MVVLTCRLMRFFTLHHSRALRLTRRLVFFVVVALSMVICSLLILSAGL